MGVEQIHRDFGLILGAGLIAQFLATITRVPETILLVAAGAGHGPDPDLVQVLEAGRHRRLPGQAFRPHRRAGGPGG
ncbi:MAG TPA: hypothetical protein VEZ19_04975 [Rubrobacter sp.]|nr:hypothetical protein [Rubrobacter sp.]